MRLALIKTGVLAAFLTSVGCVSAPAGPAGPATAVVVGSDGVSREVSTIYTGYAPKDALQKAANVMDRLGLQHVKPQGYKAPDEGFFSSESKAWPITADAFSGVAYAQTAANEPIALAASWQGRGTTTMKITTQLSPAQHGHLVELIAAELSRAPVVK